MVLFVAFSRVILWPMLCHIILLRFYCFLMAVGSVSVVLYSCALIIIIRSLIKRCTNQWTLPQNKWIFLPLSKRDVVYIYLILFSSVFCVLSYYFSGIFMKEAYYKNISVVKWSRSVLRDVIVSPQLRY